MKSILHLLALGLLLAVTPPLFGQSSTAPVDFDKARQLIEKRQKGETLAPDETAYIERAKAVRDAQAKQQGAKPPASDGAGIDWQKAQDLFRREKSGEKLSPVDQKYLDHAKEVRSKGSNRGSQRKAPESLKPISDMTADERYEGEEGGIYGNGSNEPPAALRKSAAETLARIKPLDADGRSSGSGKIGLISISMSNATQEFSLFKRIADEDPRKSGKLIIVDCAQGGQTMAAWAPSNARPWQEARNRLQNAGVSPQQVQVAWIKLANAAPSGTMTEHLTKLEADTIEVLHNAKKHFPNLRIAYLGSRIWAGNATTGLNPEPYAYEGAFAVRHLIQKQLAGDESLAPGQSPLLLWGPYLWSQGEEGRKLDNLKYLPADFASDGTHPSNTGREKVAKQLLEFFATNPLSKGWFTGM